MAVADAVTLGAWLTVLGHNVTLALRGTMRTADGVRVLAGGLLAVAVVAAGVALERASGGPVAVPRVVATIGAGLAVAGTALHVHARRALGAAWTSAVRADDVTLVDHGPYAVVRHPLYAALALLVVGTVLAHPSRATIAGGAGCLAGLALKTAWEERALAGALGERWRAYRARVPCVVPRARRPGS